MTPAQSRSLETESGPRIALVSSVPGSQPAAAVIPLLETKLYVPKRRSPSVARPGLVARLTLGAREKLTLISASAGFGKTTLLAEWLAEDGGDRAVAWVSLDPTDSDPKLFWSYVIAAFQKSRPAVGRHALASLHSSQPIETTLTALINDIDAADVAFVLVLDDYHVIDSAEIHAGMAFLIDRMPSRMHVVVASRTEPPLPLSRLRVRGELTELHAADVRFTTDETATFLRDVMTLDMSQADISTLERRTEGWVAGLQLAALSLKGRKDLRDISEGFSGGNRFIADYLVDEVLSAQPVRIRTFLSATAILDRLSGPLCEAVTGDTGAQALLEDLEDRNVFVVALDDRREWYRYHHLFADVLRSHALRDAPDLVRTFHRRASVWYQDQGSTGEAVRHAIDGQDFERAAGLLEKEWPAMDRSYESARWLERVKTIPEALVGARPVLSMGYAWALLNRGDLEAAEARLREVERWLDGQPLDPSTEMVVVDRDRFLRLPFEVASARVYLAQSRGDISGIVEHAKRCRELTPQNDHVARSMSTALLGLAEWAMGDLDAAHATFSDALAAMRAAGHDLDAIRGTFVLGDIRVAQGRLHEAAHIYRGALQLAPNQIQRGAAPETDELYLGLSELHREWGALHEAEQSLAAVTESAEQAEHRGNRQRWCTAMAAVREARGDLEGALTLLDEADAVEIRGPLPKIRPVHAMRARLWIKQGRLAEAASWARQHGLSADDELAYHREFEHITLARVLLGQQRAETDGDARLEALALLERLESAAVRGRRAGSTIEVLVLQALVHAEAGNLLSALEPLERALTLARPEGYVRVFVDEGEQMKSLLRHATARGVGGDHVRSLLAAFDEPAQPVSTPGRERGAQPEPLLTPRELVILRLIAAGLRNQEIADQLSISAATVKRHIANSYNKLGVGHRTEALARAKELNLL